MSVVRTYPAGVPCWIQLATTDPEGARRFYGGVLGWTIDGETASLHGQPVAGLDASPDARPHWRTYVAVGDVAAAQRVIWASGGAVFEGGWCADPQGAGFGLWGPDRPAGAQIVNEPGTWNFSILHGPDDAGSRRFYRAVFGWEAMDAGGGSTMWRRPGYGDHLEATVDPGIRERQAAAPEGFADAVAGMAASQASGEPAVWRVTFTVADRDASADAVQRLGGEVISTTETMWTREALICDPQGAELTLSQFAPPGDWSE